MALKHLQVQKDNKPDQMIILGISKSISEFWIRSSTMDRILEVKNYDAKDEFKLGCVVHYSDKIKLHN